MVTLTFDLIALLVGFLIGVIVGVLVFALFELRNGGSWDIGFDDGCELKNIVERLEILVEAKKEE